MKKQVVKILIAQGFEKEEAEMMASNMSEIDLYEVIEQGGV